MEKITNNHQKYDNYKAQMNRLNSAIKSGFFLEAIFIEYAIMEDRLESILRHLKDWDSNQKSHVSLVRKNKKIRKLAENEKSIANKYFNSELHDDIEEWKTKRNSVIHALLKHKLTKKDLEEIAIKGKSIANRLCVYSNKFKRAVKKEELKSSY